MKAWKILAIIGLVVGFTAVAQAESATNGTSLNGTSLNRLTANKLASNKLSANRLTANEVSANQPGEGAAADIIAIELPNGIRFAR